MAEALPHPPAAASRGKLKIFFGAFPGAGKTDAMLAAARRVRDAGRDVVIGVLDMHGREDVAALTTGFEVVSSPATGQLDLDAVLRRRPEVVLVDDLAHANPAGSRHPKRWNDVDELLANGIDVFTTMSVQHLESLNDIVADITGIPETETVPDTFFDTADETVMVDMSADELLLRLREGKVPTAHVNQGEKGQLFRKGSLLALREIALRRTADVVEDEVVKYRSAEKIAATWKTHGRLLCCIGPDPGSEHVVRSAARLAGQLDEPWTAVYVETPRLQRMATEERARILQVVSLARELGARTAILTGNAVADTVVEYARSENISTIVLGRSSARGPGASLGRRIGKLGDEFDVVVIGHARGESTPVLSMQSFKQIADPRRGEKRARYVWTLATVVLTTVALSFLHALDLANIVMVYTLSVLLVALRWGRGPAIVSAALNVLAFDFFFVPPRFSLVPEQPHHVITFAVMLAVGVLIGQLVGNIRFQVRVSAHREKRARTLYDFAQDLALLQTTSEVIEKTEEFMSRHFRARVAVLVPDATGALVSPTARGMTNPFDSTTAQWAYDRAQQAGAGTDTLAGNEYLFLPLKSPTRTRGVLAIRPERPRDLMIPEQRHQFDIFAALVATALERVYYMDVARDALLMARIQGGDMKLDLERKPMRELIEESMKPLGALLTKHPLTLDVAHDLPLVSVDVRLMQRVFTSLAGNVAKHTPADTPMAIRARVVADRMEVAVEDAGPGLPEGREQAVFESFSRGENEPARKGAGLGLAITRAIVEAHGGSIRAERADEKGARFVISLPLRR